MRGKAPLSRDSYVRDLPFSVIKHLAFDLDMSSLWENFVVEIPKSLSSNEENFVPRYTALHVGLFSRQLQTPNGSPTRAILQDWGTQNCTIQDLLNVLCRANLTAAVNFIKHTVLKEADDSQPEEPYVEELPIPSSLLPPLVINAVPGDHPNRVQVPDDPDTGVSEVQFDSIKKEGREPVQNDLSLTPPTSLSDSQTRNHQKYYDSLGGAGAPAMDEPNKNSVCYEKVQEKLPEKKIDHNILQQNTCPPPLKCPGVKMEPVIKNTGDLQNIPYGDLEEITDGFNQKLHSAGGRLIGKGGFGTVHLGVDRDKKWVAVKVLKDNTETLRKQFRTEVNTLSNLKHKNLLSLLGYSSDGTQSCIVYDYMPNGSLEDRLGCLNGTPPLPAELRINICKGSARAIVFLNQLGYIHRDIKSANILLDKDFVPKLGDFATTRMGPSGDGKTQAGTSVLIGTSAYLAPEAHNFDVSTKLDSFSFGVVVLELLTGLPAYDSKREDKDLRSHMQENCEDIMLMVDRYGGDWVESSVRVLYKIACQCLQHRKKKRVNVVDVIQEIENL